MINDFDHSRRSGDIFEIATLAKPCPLKAPFFYKQIRNIQRYLNFMCKQKNYAVAKRKSEVAQKWIL